VQSVQKPSNEVISNDLVAFNELLQQQKVQNVIVIAP